MKNFYLITVLFLSGYIVYAQSPNWEWAKSAAQIGTGSNQNVCSDAEGNVYVTGGFTSPTITFGSYTLTNNSLINGSNIFLVKYDSSGNVLWAKSAGGASNDVAEEISIDAAGDVFVSGYYSSQYIIFGNDTFTNSLPDVSTDFFLVKYDPNGNIYWATNAGITSTGHQFMSADALGNVYLTGDFSGHFETVGYDTLYDTHSNGSDIFIIKYNLTGGMAWAKTAGGATQNGNDYGQSITANASGNVYVTGYYVNDTMHFAQNTLTGSGFFLLKYDSTGAEIWAREAGSSGFITENGQSMATDASGNIFITGDFTGSSMTFGNTSIANSNSNSGSTEIYLVKYNASGNVLWAKGAGGTGFNISNGVSVDDSGNAYITGNFGSSLIIFGNDAVVNNGNGNYTGGIFAVKYDTAGNEVWALGGGGDASDASTGITVDAFGDVYITGYFQGNSITFGNTALTDASHSDNDFYVAKFGNHPPVTGVQNINSFAEVKVYPNPSTGNFLFSGMEPGATIEIYNTLGELMYSSMANNPDYWLNLSNLAKGIYFYRVSEPSGLTTRSRLTTIQQGKIILE